MYRTRAGVIVAVMFLSVAPDRPASSQVDQCLANFKEGGSIFKGKVLETYEEFPGLDVTTALRRLQSQLAAHGFAIVSVDADQGIIKGENQDPNSRPFPMEYTVTPAPSGVRVRLWLKMLAGQMVAGGTKSAICDLIRLVNIEPPPPPPPPKPPEPPLTNEEIVRLVQAGLDDEIITAKIGQSPRVELDVSPDALVELQKMKVSKAVVGAMLARSGNGAAMPSAIDSQAAHSEPVPSKKQAPVAKPVSDAARLARPLDRSTALGLIAESKEGSAARYETIYLGLAADSRSGDFLGIGNWQFVDALVRTGYMQNQGNRLLLTAKGNAASADWQRDPDRPTARLIPVATHEISIVTGITEAQLGAGTVAEFTWIWRATPIAEELGNLDSRIAQKYGRDEHAGQALFKYYDDGWRVQKIQWE